MLLKLLRKFVHAPLTLEVNEVPVNQRPKRITKEDGPSKVADGVLQTEGGRFIYVDATVTCPLAPTYVEDGARKGPKSVLIVKEKEKERTYREARVDCIPLAADIFGNFGPKLKKLFAVLTTTLVMDEDTTRRFKHHLKLEVFHLLMKSTTAVLNLDRSARHSDATIKRKLQTLHHEFIVRGSRGL